METKFAVGRLVLSCAAVAMSGLLAAGAARAESVTKVYQSRMHDGSLSFGDKPAQGAIETESRDYRLPDAPPAAMLEAERRNWAEQNRAFEQRYTDRLAIEAMQERQRKLETMLLRGASAAAPTETLVYGGAPRGLGCAAHPSHAAHGPARRRGLSQLARCRERPWRTVPVQRLPGASGVLMPGHPS
ncbi:hypothetical protein V8H18_13795 [Lautropia mirabilis]